MGRKLKVTVYLDGNVDGRPKALLAGSEPTAEEAKAIKNPDVWEDAEGSAVEEAAGTGSEDAAEPPRGGAGATTEAWATYAASLGVTVPEDASRDEIIAAVDAHRGG